MKIRSIILVVELLSQIFTFKYMTRKVNKIKKQFVISVINCSRTLHIHVSHYRELNVFSVFGLCSLLRIDKIILSKEIYNNINKRRKCRETLAVH